MAKILQRGNLHGNLCVRKGLNCGQLCCRTTTCRPLLGLRTLLLSTSLSTTHQSTGHDMQSAKQATRLGPFGGRTPWPLACIPQEPCERRALTLVAEALRALSGLGFCSVGSWAKMTGATSSDWDCTCFVGHREAEEGRRLGPAVHCKMRAYYKASAKRRQL